MKKSFRILIPLLALVLIFSGCGKSKIQELKDGIAQFNTQTPMDLGIGELQYVTYDDEANTVVFKFMLKSEYDDVFNYSPTPKEGMAALLTTNQMRPMVELLAEAGAGMKWEYRSPLRDDVLAYDFSPSEINDALHSDKSHEESYEDFVASVVESSNSECPVEVEEGMTITRVYDDGSNIIYICEIDEDMYDMAAMEGMKSEVKSMLLDDPLISTLVDKLSAANRGVVYRYVGKESGDICEIAL